jgi:hypothetical protein
MTMSIIAKKVERKRGTWSLFKPKTKGYNTKARSVAMVMGSSTGAVSFMTAPVMIQQIKTIRKKLARPELKALNISIMPVLCPILLFFYREFGYFYEKHYKNSNILSFDLDLTAKNHYVYNRLMIRFR